MKLFSFKQFITESKSLEKLNKEKEERSKENISSSNSSSQYLSIGHDSSEYDTSFKNDKEFRDKLHSILRNVYGITPGKESTPPDLWASGPSIKRDTSKGETLVSVRPLSAEGQTHADIFPDAYVTDPVSGSRSHPHVYGRVDHVRKIISMQTNHSRYFSNNSLEQIHKELKSRYPNYEVHDMIGTYR